MLENLLDTQLILELMKLGNINKLALVNNKRLRRQLGEERKLINEWHIYTYPGRRIIRRRTLPPNVRNMLYIRGVSNLHFWFFLIICIYNRQFLSPRIFFNWDRGKQLTHWGEVMLKLACWKNGKMCQQKNLTSQVVPWHVMLRNPYFIH